MYRLTQPIALKITMAALLLLVSLFVQACAIKLLPTVQDVSLDEEAITSNGDTRESEPLIAFKEGADEICYTNVPYLALMFFREELKLLKQSRENSDLIPYLGVIDVEFADPALLSFLKSLASSLCGPLQPYRATYRYAFNNGDLSAKGYTRIDNEMVINVASFEEYMITDGHNNNCVRSGNKVYRIENDKWQEFHNLDTPACGNPLEVIAMPFLSLSTPRMPADGANTPFTIEATLIHGGVRELEGKETKLYELVLEPPSLQKPGIIHRNKMTIWIDSQSRLPLRIDYRPIDGAETIDGSMLFWRIDIEHGIKFVSPIN